MAGAVAVVLPLLLPSPSAPEAPVPTQAVETQWLDADGNPLPLQTDEEEQEFLRTAKVVKLERIGRGVAGTRKALLRKGHIEMSAAFRTVSVEERERRLGDRVILFFRDDYRNEPAAYALSELLGLDMVPPAVERAVRDQPGSLQMWLEDTRPAVELVEEGLEAPSQKAILLQYYQMQVFDNLIQNLDRNQGNILVDRNWRVWLIDHTRAFIRDERLPAPDKVRRCERGLWERLRTVSDEEIRAAVDPYLPLPESNGLLKRRQRLVELIQGKIDHLGEAGVLFDRSEMLTHE
jgi:hypothetical protein